MRKVFSSLNEFYIKVFFHYSLHGKKVFINSSVETFLGKLRYIHGFTQENLLKAWVL